MRKLVMHDTPQPVPLDVTFETVDGSEGTLGDYTGKVTLVNFWATWCVPCRDEMPALSQLQSDLGGDDFEVVTIASGRNPPPAMEKFFEEIGVDNLPLHRDPTQALAREMGVLGLPITVIVDREGNELGRLQGGADWASEDAKAVVEGVIGG
ncbi:TlpA family protein disulfide reductase [Pelagovum pacificum]|nr:TlpA disulfide reductase family protein [Pelagovum pacificum]